MANVDESLDHARTADTLTIMHGRPEAPGARVPFELGATLGRYLLIEKIGEGGMGVVLRAYDPKLHREVALKQLHRDALDSDGEARLVREAQAMAQLAHPNVITIHDVERTDEGVVMAMEYVEGQTLAQWIAAGPHPWRQVLARFLQAGEGLQAAHRAGLVHRDFKPSNAIVGPDGRVRVMDFGLARAQAGAVAESSGTQPITEVGAHASAQPAAPSSSASLQRLRSAELRSSDSLSVQLTEAGAVMGTPSYMSPEQHRGDVADARSDQYAFCVSLWEGLWRTRPFRGALPTIVEAKQRGAPAMPRTDKVPRWLYDALCRGLRADAAERWPSMTELLAVLALDPARRRRRWLAAGASVAVLAGAGATVMWQGSAQEPPCLGARAELAGVWDEARRAEVGAALERTGLGYAPAIWARTAEELDGYAERWVKMRTEACEATAVHKVQSASLLDLRMQCLRRRKLHLLAAVDVLAGADAEVAKTAIQQVTGLPTLDRCADADALLAEVPPPEDPEVARAVEQLRDDLTRAEAQQGAGRYAEAQAILEELEARSIPLAYDPVLAEVLEVDAGLADLQGDFPRAVENGTRAYALALRAGATRVAAEAALGLLYVTGHRQSHVEIGRTWATSALALAQRSDPQGVAEAMAYNGFGVLAYQAGDYGAATDYFEQALPMLVNAVGEEHDLVATTLNHLGVMLDEQGRYAEAEPHFRRALAIHLAVFGAEHPRPANSMENLALCLQAQGRNEEGRDLHLQSLALRQRTLGENHPDTALTENNLGWDYMGLHDVDTAAQYFTRALAGFEAAFGKEHPRVAMAAESLALAELERHHYELAEALHRRALSIRRMAMGEDHPNVALSLAGLGELAHRRGRHDESVALFEEARVIIENKAEGAERHLGDILMGLGKALVETGRFAEARPHLERALALRESGTGIDPVVVADVRLLLASARWGEGDDPEAARAQVRLALASLVGNEGEAAKRKRAELEGWLEAHP